MELEYDFDLNIKTIQSKVFEITCGSGFSKDLSRIIAGFTI